MTALTRVRESDTRWISFRNGDLDSGADSGEGKKEIDKTKTRTLWSQKPRYKMELVEAQSRKED